MYIKSITVIITSVLHHLPCLYLTKHHIDIFTTFPRVPISNSHYCGHLSTLHRPQHQPPLLSHHFAYLWEHLGRSSDTIHHHYPNDHHRQPPMPPLQPYRVPIPPTIVTRPAPISHIVTSHWHHLVGNGYPHQYLSDGIGPHCRFQDFGWENKARRDIVDTYPHASVARMG
jgi:hypothetical protein